MLLSAQYGIREPSQSERDFFRSNPSVGGYAAPDQSVVLNPYSGQTPRQQAAVATNEAARLRMMDDGAYFGFPLAEHQQSFFAGTPYGSQPQMARHSVVARILSGDPSAGPYTADQEAAAQSVLYGLLMR